MSGLDGGGVLDGGRSARSMAGARSMGGAGLRGRARRPGRAGLRGSTAGRVLAGACSTDPNGRPGDRRPFRMEDF